MAGLNKKLFKLATSKENRTELLKEQFEDIVKRRFQNPHDLLIKRRYKMIREMAVEIGVMTEEEMKALEEKYNTRGEAI